MNESETTIELDRMSKKFAERSDAEIIIIATTWGTMSMVTLIGNLITILIVLRNRSLWTPTNMLIASLAFSDFGFAVTNVVPIGTTTLASRSWPFSWETCQYQGYIAIVMATASIQTLGFTAVNRFYRVVKPPDYDRYFSKKRTAILIAISWFLALLAPVPYLAGGNKFIFQPAKGFCYLEIDSGPYTAFLVSTYIGIPGTAICYCYLRVFLAVRKHKVQITQSSNVSSAEIKVTKTLFVIVFVFMCCWTPVLAIDVIDTVSGQWIMPSWLYLTYSYLTLISSCVNPVIYVIMNPAFRTEYVRLVTCKACKREVADHRAERGSENPAVQTSSTAV